MRIEKYKFTLEAESTEGIHDFIPMLEDIIEAVKGGIEKDEGDVTIDGVARAKAKWSIDSVMSKE